MTRITVATAFASALAAGAISLLASGQLAASGPSRPQVDTAPGTPAFQATGELHAGSLGFVERVEVDGATPASLGWDPREQGIRAAVAQEVSHGQVVIGTRAATHEVCLALILSDWEPSTCTSRDVAERGGFYVSAQATAQSAIITAGVVPDGASVRLNGVELDVVNNVWVADTDHKDEVQVIDSAGGSLVLTIG